MMHILTPHISAIVVIKLLTQCVLVKNTKKKNILVLLIHVTHATTVHRIKVECNITKIGIKKCTVCFVIRVKRAFLIKTSWLRMKLKTMVLNRTNVIVVANCVRPKQICIVTWKFIPHLLKRLAINVKPVEKHSDALVVTDDIFNRIWDWNTSVLTVKSFWVQRTI